MKIIIIILRPKFNKKIFRDYCAFPFQRLAVTIQRFNSVFLLELFGDLDAWSFTLQGIKIIIIIIKFIYNTRLLLPGSLPDLDALP